MADPVHSSMGNIIEVADPVTPGMPGQRNQATLNEAFSRSPIYDPAGNAGVEEKFTKLVMEGTVKDIVDGQPAAVPGFGFSTFNRDFVDAPDLSEENTALTDSAGNTVPFSHVPNVASPNESATEQENVVEPRKPSNGGAFVGNNLKNPSDSSKSISRLSIGSFMRGGLFGKSSPDT